MEYYGQKQEDRVAHEYFKRCPDSRLSKTFLDIGAYDGRHLSNTLFFEQLGWRGLCVEADEAAFQALRQNRKCLCLHCACSDHEGTVDFFSQPERPMGTTSVEAVEKLQSGWNFQTAGKKSVPARTVDQILAEHGFRELDFVSIDVDGAEVQVLRGFDLARTQPKLICIETNFKEVKKGKWPRAHVEEIHRILTGHGYRRLKIHGANSFYCRDRFPRLVRLRLALGV